MNVPASFDDALVRTTTQEVLGRPEYQEPGAVTGVFEFVDRLRAWAPELGRWVHDHPVLGWLAVALLVLVLTVLSIQVIRAFLGDAWLWRDGRRRSSMGTGVTVPTLLGGGASSWPEGLERAQAALASGDARRAVWIAHRVLLEVMDEAGAIRFKVGKTNTDYLGEVADEHPWRGVFERLTGAYERVVYGDRDPETEPLGPLLDEVRACVGSRGS
jgi:hypothetical protein